MHHTQKVVSWFSELHATASIRSQDIVRDADILNLYRRAGFLYVLMGVETVTDATLEKVHKESSVSEVYQAVQLLRKHGILYICAGCAARGVAEMH